MDKIGVMRWMGQKPQTTSIGDFNFHCIVGNGVVILQNDAPSQKSTALVMNSFALLNDLLT